MHRTDKHSQDSSIIWLVWLNGQVFGYELSGYRLESRFCYLNVKYNTYLEQGVPCDSEKL